MLRAIHRVWQHANEPPGRHQLIERDVPCVAGLLNNTPWPIKGQHVPTQMVHAVHAALDAARVADPGTLCLQVLERVQASLQPFVGAAATGVFEDWEASWDFGGSAGLVVTAGAQTALARVGEVRVVELPAQPPR